MSQPKTLSLVIPCYNEEKNLPTLFDKCGALLARENVEIIFVNNGSTDNSAKILNHFVKQRSNSTVVEVSINQGYGFGIMAGISQAEADIVGWTHADIQTDPVDVLTAFDLMCNDDDLDFVKGRRLQRPIFDAIFSWGMSIFETVLFCRPLYEINAQPTLFKRKFAKNFTSPPKDFSLDLYCYLVAKKANASMTRIGVFFGDRLYGESSWNKDFVSKLKFIRRTVNYSVKLRMKGY